MFHSRKENDYEVSSAFRMGYFHNNLTNFLSGGRRMKGFISMGESMGSNGHVLKSDYP
jgi:hypothetical protein